MSLHEISKINLDSVNQKTYGNTLFSKKNSTREVKNQSIKDINVSDNFKLNKQLQPSFTKADNQKNSIKIKNSKNQLSLDTKKFILNKRKYLNKSVELQQNHNVHFNMKSQDYKNKSIENQNYFESYLLECPIVIKPKKNISTTNIFEYSGLKVASSMSMKLKKPTKMPAIMSYSKRLEPAESFRDQMKHRFEKNASLKNVEVDSRSLMNIFKEHIDLKQSYKEQVRREIQKNKKQQEQNNQLKKSMRKIKMIKMDKNIKSPSKNSSINGDNTDLIVNNKNKKPTNFLINSSSSNFSIKREQM